MAVEICDNCHHRKSLHKKVDGHSFCSSPLCACKNFIEARIPANRYELHRALDDFLDEIERPPRTEV